MGAQQRKVHIVFYYKRENKVTCLHVLQGEFTVMTNGNGSFCIENLNDNTFLYWKSCYLCGYFLLFRNLIWKNNDEN